MSDKAKLDELLDTVASLLENAVISNHGEVDADPVLYNRLREIVYDLTGAWCGDLAPEPDEVEDEDGPPGSNPNDVWPP